MTISPGARVELPADRFFWAVLDANGLPGHRRGHFQTARLGFLFENVLPVPIEDVQAVYQPVEGDPPRVLACGMTRSDLQAAIADSRGELLTLAPTGLPEFVRDADIDPRSLNLLRAVFEPKTVRHLKLRLLWQAAAVIALSAGLISSGLERRTAVVQRRVEQARSARTELIRQALGNDRPSAANAQPLDLRFLAELRTLRQTRQPASLGQSASSALSDATGSLSDLLKAWPVALHVLTDSISITPTAMTLRGQAPESGDVQSLANALSDLNGWQFQQPQVTSSPPYGVNATLQWKREAPAAREGAPTS